MTNSIVLKVNGMTGKASEATINSKLEALPGVISAQTSFGNKEVKLDFNTDKVCLYEINEVIADAGYEVIQE
jgi:copper chaperone CopZ